MLLANRYGLFDPTFFNNLSGINLLQCDLLILNSIVREENEAVEANRKKTKERQDHPGMERFESVDDFWEEVDEANSGVWNGHQGIHRSDRSFDLSQPCSGKNCACRTGK